MINWLSILKTQKIIAHFLIQFELKVANFEFDI